MDRFNDKVVIITGAGSGMGKATAERFATEGAKVVIAGRRKAPLDALAAELSPAKVLVQTCDVSQESEVEALVKAAVDAFGGIDVLVNNAGVVVSGDVTQTSTADWRKVMSIDLDGVFFMSRAAMPHLRASKGSIVNVASVSGTGGDWGMAAYNAAKGGVVNLTRAMAMDHGKDGVRVNAVCPSSTRTPMGEGVVTNDALMAKFQERFALEGPAEPEDIAGAVAFLASRDARFITGVNLPVDGGISASNGQPQQ
ncbi:SDR family NAD(P)-dependent oxidoreductase [Rhizobium halophytocola]|uniref:Meso-butanediol dehydrogenase/(S,S)-butanediol dehydrogenase/diacetyl reductase n=1 Tax=Rhizobium halophytocola TaxID=735519 RepID=A0ABS4DT86_9HYPH|nr:SDR family oxidoreductase [Rhizobium halophytocola]MBP1848911.1 meso-butanediol dehydrogenase/(S,S)-butanediol dehydrogenase/diacetyl reductase [Rhizobium halophytocola]